MLLAGILFNVCDMKSLTQKSESEDDMELPTRNILPRLWNAPTNNQWKKDVVDHVDLNFVEYMGSTLQIDKSDKPVDFFPMSCTLLMKCLSSWLNRLIVTLNKWGYTARPDKHKTHWSTVTADELKSDWLALTLNMALVNKPTIQSYWTTQHINSIFFSTMSRTGYQQILRHLHFVDNSSNIIKDCAENIFFELSVSFELGAYIYKWSYTM